MAFSKQRGRSCLSQRPKTCVWFRCSFGKFCSVCILNCQMTPKEVEVLREQFLDHAKSKGEDGSPEMTEADFWNWVEEHSTLSPRHRTREFLTVLFHLADSNKNAKISFEEFLLFVRSICTQQCTHTLSNN